MANYNLSLPAETIDSLLLWLDDKQGIIIKQTDLLSGTGQSTTATMTQKAITDALGTKADANNVYTKTETDTLLGGKADKSTTYTKTETDTLLNGKVDKEAGKGLSANDYTDADKTKLGALPTAAELDSELAALAGEAGLAEAVIDTDGAGTEQEFTFRQSGGDGGAYYRKIKGKTLALNQLMYNGNFSGGNEGWSGSGSVSGGVYTVSWSTQYSNNGIYQTINQIETIVGHKYFVSAWLHNLASASIIYILGVPYASYSDYVSKNYAAGEKGMLKGIYTATVATVSGSGGNSFKLFASVGTSPSVEVTNVQVFDLTQMFGAGNEPSSVAEFEALYPDVYYPYNPGTLISNDAEAVETTGRNQYNPATGKAQVIGGTTYYIGGTYTSLSQGGIAITPAGDGTFTPASTGEVEVVGGNATDTIINISDADNGLWQPYWKRTLQLGITTRKDTDGNVPFADGMKGDASVQDWCDKTGGEKRKIRIKVSDLTWANSYGGSFATVVSSYGIKGSGSSSDVGNIICAPYTAYSTNAVTASSHPDKSIAINGTGDTVYIQDSAYGSAAAFATAKADELIELELATPVPFTWAEPLNLGVKVDENGTERAVAPEGATEPSAPFVADTTYTMSVARMVEILKNL